MSDLVSIKLADQSPFVFRTRNVEHIQNAGNGHTRIYFGPGGHFDCALSCQPFDEVFNLIKEVDDWVGE